MQPQPATKPVGSIHYRIIENVESNVDPKSKEAKGAKKGKPMFKVVVKTERKNYLIQGETTQEIEEWVLVLKKGTWLI